MKAGKIWETLEVIPRYLCLCIEEGDSRFYFSPANEVMGNTLRRSPRILNRIIESTGKYKQWQAGQYKKGSSYEPKFPWPEKLLNEENENLPEILRYAIKKKDGTFILYDSEPHEAVKDLTLKGNVLSALVKSKRGIDETRPTYHITSLRNAHLDEFGNPELRVIECTCDDYAYDLEKGGEKKSFVGCTHNNSMRSQNEHITYLQPSHLKSQIKTKGKPVIRPLFSPFNFTSNWVYSNGIYQPKNKHLAALEADVLITYYIISGSNDDFFGINERLLAIEECYSPSLMEWIRSGKVKRRVLGQRRKSERVSHEKWLDDQHIAVNLDANIRAHGYEYDGMSREFNHIARRYINTDTGNSVGVIFRGLEEPFYVVREPLHGSVPKPSGEQPKIADPLKLVGKRNLVTFDDVTMKETKTRVEMPSVLRLPDCGTIDTGLHKQTRKRFRDALRKANGGEVTGIEKYAHVHYI